MASEEVYDEACDETSDEMHTKEFAKVSDELSG